MDIIKEDNIYHPLIKTCIGQAYSALGRKDDDVIVWEQGYKHVFHQFVDLKQLIELLELVTTAKQSMVDVKHLSKWSVSKPEPNNSVRTSETSNNHTMSSIGYEPIGDSREIESKQNHVSSNGNHEKQQNGTYNISVDFGARSSTSDTRKKSDLSTKISLVPSKSSDNDKSDMNSEPSNDAKGNKSSLLLESQCPS